MRLGLFDTLEPAYALFSGGKDSFACARYLQEHGMLLGCVALRTGISVPDWEPSVRALCERHGFPVEFYDTTSRYEDVVRKFGFPGPAQHGMFMNYLKGRAIRAFRKARPGATLASGVRMYESSRRAVSTRPVSKFEGVKIIAPVYDWTTERVWAYCRAHGYERPMAYSTLQISGDCLCGAFARPDEREALRYWYPDVADRIDALEREMPDGPTSRWGWGCNRQARKQGAEAIVCVECGELELS